MIKTKVINQNKEMIYPVLTIRALKDFLDRKLSILKIVKLYVFRCMCSKILTIKHNDIRLKAQSLVLVNC